MHDVLGVVEVEKRLAELEHAGLDVRIREMIAKRPTVEEQQAALQEWDQAVYFCWYERRLEAAINGEYHFSDQNSSGATRPSTGGPGWM